MIYTADIIHTHTLSLSLYLPLSHLSPGRTSMPCQRYDIYSRYHTHTLSLSISLSHTRTYRQDARPCHAQTSGYEPTSAPRQKTRWRQSARTRDEYLSTFSKVSVSVHSLCKAALARAFENVCRERAFRKSRPRTWRYRDQGRRFRR